MVSLYLLPAVIFIVGYSICIAAAAPLLEPIFFFNLTQHEFMLKQSEHRLTKRAVVGEESLNFRDPFGQALVEALSEDCVEKNGEGARAFGGKCIKNSVPAMMEIRCGRPPRNPTAFPLQPASRTCVYGQICEYKSAFNYYGRINRFPYCKDNFHINKRPGPEVEIPPRYNGWMWLTDSWQVSNELPSPGTIDFHFEVAGQYPGLKGSWEYRGHWSNGWSFLAGSHALATSFGCVGCPSGGALYAETIGFKAQAAGLTLPNL